MSAWHKHFHAKIVEMETSPELFYNADQTGLYYQNLPNCVYIDEINKKDYAGLKKGLYKNYIILMVGTSYSGGKGHFLLLGNQKNPECFKLMDGARLPLPFKKIQANYWFD